MEESNLQPVSGQFDVPVLFLVFNRPDTTAKVFGKIREIKPKQLFVAADGPRQEKEGEREKCEAVRKLILQGIDWPCDLKTLFRDNNLGCGKAVSSAITWFFENVDEGVILEDDTLPSLSFFNFCRELLQRYRDHLQIKMISGSNYDNRPQIDDSNYYFTAFPHIWGWASWRRVWKEYDFALNDLTESDVKKILPLYFRHPEIIISWQSHFNAIKRKKADTWDFQLGFSIWKNSGFNIVSKENLISNIGYGADSTHTSDKKNILASVPLKEIDKLVHPDIIIINRIQDDWTERKIISSGNTGIKKRIKAIVHKIWGINML